MEVKLILRMMNVILIGLQGLYGDLALEAQRVNVIVDVLYNTFRGVMRAYK